MVMASWPAASGRGGRPVAAESVRRRVRGAMRRAVRHAVRYGTPAVAVGIGADVVHLLLRFGEAASLSAALSGLAIVLTFAFLVLATRFHRRPEAAAFGILVVFAGATLLNARLMPELLPISAGYLALIMVGAALFLPWSPHWHMSWLAVVVTLSAGQLATSSPDTAPAAASALVVTVLAVLVSAIGHPLAYFRMQSALEQHFELRRLSRVAQGQERAVEELRRELVRTARIDTVTGIGNRRALDEAMLALAGTRLAAVLLDLDHFKAFNDRNGHLAGDEALSRVGEILRNTVRRDDLVFRYGGEEFLILAPDSDRTEAERLAERVRLAVQDDPRVGPWGLTVSAGVAVADRFSASNPLGLLRRADTALYQAKRGGRNRVVADDPSGTTLKVAGSA